MALQNNDPLLAFAEDGRLRTVPYSTRMNVVPLVLSFDNLSRQLVHVLQLIFNGLTPIRNAYTGTNDQRTALINQDITDMVSLALWTLYNRLRAAAERFSPETRTARMNTRAPVSARLEFPGFLARMLQSIGPLRIPDTNEDVLVLYVPPEGTHQNYGRGAAQAPFLQRYQRFTDALRSMNIPFAVIDQAPAYGSYWPTVISETDEDQLMSFIGTCHSAHYVTEDVAYASVGFALTAHPVFEDTMMCAGRVDNAAVIAALAAVAPPAADVAQPNHRRHVGATYDVNYRGIFPAVAEAAGVPAVAAHCYVVGFGATPIRACYLVRHLAEYDLRQIWLHRFFT